MRSDTRELDELVLDLTRAPNRVQRAVPQALEKKIGPALKRQMKIDATGHKGNWFGRPGTSYNTPVERHVSYEMLTNFLLEVGIENKGAGKLAHIIVFGSANNEPVYDHMAALRREMPSILNEFGDLGEDSVLGRQR